MTDEELRQLAESNARAVQAMLEQRVTDRLEHEERLRLLEDNQRQIVLTQRGIANLLVDVGVKIPTISQVNR